MTEKNLLDKLDKLQVPRVETPNHKENLKRALLAAHQARQPKPFIFPNPFIDMKKFAPVSLLALFLVGGALYATNLLNSPVASAKELIEQAIAKVEHSKMAPEEQQKVIAVLKQAKEAKDLKFLGEKTTVEDGKLKSLGFTDSSGKAVVVDLDEDDAEKPVNLTGTTSESALTESQEAKTEEKVESSKTESEVKATPSQPATEVKTESKETEVKSTTSTSTAVTSKESAEAEDKAEVKSTESKVIEPVEKAESPEVSKENVETEGIDQ